MQIPSFESAVVFIYISPLAQTDHPWKNIFIHKK
jgi:hypothetical protein